MCTHEGKKKYLADGESAHPSTSITVCATPGSHQEAEEPQDSNCCRSHIKNFLGKLPAGRISLFHFPKLADSVKTARQNIISAGDSNFAGDHGCIMGF